MHFYLSTSLLLLSINLTATESSKIDEETITGSPSQINEVNGNVIRQKHAFLDSKRHLYRRLGALKDKKSRSKKNILQKIAAKFLKSKTSKNSEEQNNTVIVETSPTNICSKNALNSIKAGNCDDKTNNTPNLSIKAIVDSVLEQTDEIEVKEPCPRVRQPDSINDLSAEFYDPSTLPTPNVSISNGSKEENVFFNDLSISSEIKNESPAAVDDVSVSLHNNNISSEIHLTDWLIKPADEAIGADQGRIDHIPETNQAQGQTEIISSTTGDDASQYLTLSDEDNYGRWSLNRNEDSRMSRSIHADFGIEIPNLELGEILVRQNEDDVNDSNSVSK